MSAVAECYSRPGTPFGAKGPFYHAEIGHRGMDYYRGARQLIYAYEPGTVRLVSSSAGLGGVMAIQLDQGLYAGWAHLFAMRLEVGDRVRFGTPIAEVAGWGDRPGDLWSGPHIHTTLSGSAWGAAFGGLPLYDPEPRIAAAIAASAPAGGIGSPILPAPNERETEMYVTTWRDHIISFAPEQVKHETEWDHAQFVRNVTASDDRFIALDDAGMTAMCETFGVPWYAVEQCLNGTAFKITGERVKTGGKFWSRSLEDRERLNAALAALGAKAATLDPALAQKTITDALTAASAGGIVAKLTPDSVRDVAAAVNGDFAKRIAE
jgi:hypothetical protein